MKSNCWFCGSELIWGGDFTYEDYGMEDDGIVANLSCSSSECDTYAEFYNTIKKKEEENVNKSKSMGQ